MNISWYVTLLVAIIIHTIHTYRQTVSYRPRFTATIHQIPCVGNIDVCNVYIVLYWIETIIHRTEQYIFILYYIVPYKNKEQQEEE